MRNVLWTDENGYKRMSQVKDSDTDDKAPFGIPVGPPDPNLIDWEDVKKQINNTFADLGVFTYADLQASQLGLQTVATIVKRAYQDAFFQQSAK